MPTFSALAGQRDARGWQAGMRVPLLADLVAFLGLGSHFHFVPSCFRDTGVGSEGIQEMQTHGILSSWSYNAPRAEVGRAAGPSPWQSEAFAWD